MVKKSLAVFHEGNFLEGWNTRYIPGAIMAHLVEHFARDYQSGALGAQLHVISCDAWVLSSSLQPYRVVWRHYQLVVVRILHSSKSLIVVCYFRFLVYALRQQFSSSHMTRGFIRGVFGKRREHRKGARARHVDIVHLSCLSPYQLAPIFRPHAIFPPFPHNIDAILYSVPHAPPSQLQQQAKQMGISRSIDPKS